MAYIWNAKSELDHGVLFSEVRNTIITHYLTPLSKETKRWIREHLTFNSADYENGIIWFDPLVNVNKPFRRDQLLEALNEPKEPGENSLNFEDVNTLRRAARDKEYAVSLLTNDELLAAIANKLKKGEVDV